MMEGDNTDTDTEKGDADKLTFKKMGRKLAKKCLELPTHRK
jgi:hypothetical protein